MKSLHVVCIAAVVLSLGLLAGMTVASPHGNEAKIKANLAKLSPEDRKLAEEQRWCAVEEENELGAMGKPIKVMVKGEPVFLCCKACVKSAQQNPDQTLAKVKELREKAAKSK